MATRSSCFDRPRTPAGLVAARRKNPWPGATVKLNWPAEYPEAFFRLTLSFANENLLYMDDVEVVRESSPLFWEPGTAAQILLWSAGRGGAWSLSLTRWGVLRWQFGSSVSGAAAWLESRTMLNNLARVNRPFCAGVTIARVGPDGKTRVRLLVGEPDGPVAVLAEGQWDLPAGVERPTGIIVGQAPRRRRPMKARATELLAANTELYQIFQGRWRDRTGTDTSRPNASGLACRLDKRTVLAYPGTDLSSTTSNYWHHFAITDPAVRRVRFGKTTDMSTRFFASPDRRDWFGLAARQIPSAGSGGRCVEVMLPRRRGVLHIANAPVYDEQQRDADLAEAVRLGARVHRAAVSRGGLPVHAVELTNFSTNTQGKIGVAMICGQHSPVEQMTGFLGLPLLRELVKLHAAGPARGILDRLVFFWVPIFNIDCCRRGIAGITLDGANPNRRWFEGRGPEQIGVEKFFLARRRERLRLGLMIDCHAGDWHNHTVLAHYMLPHEQVEKATKFGRPQRPLPLCPADQLKQKWFALLNRHAGLREIWENGVSGKKLNAAPQWFQSTFGCPAITFECSVGSNFDPATRRTRRFDLKTFQDMGRRLTHAIAAGISLLETGAKLKTSAADKR